jgi:C4-dicarboxylate transporter DctQ subunit
MFLKVLDRLEEFLIASLIAGATLLIFVAVVHRYALDVSAKWAWSAPAYDVLFKINLSWAQELCIYMFVWMAKFGAAYGVRTGIHVGVDVLVNRLPPKWRLASVMFSLLAGAFFTGVIATLGTIFVWNMAHTDQTSPDLEMPMWIVYLAIPLGSSLMSFRFLQVAWGFLRTGELPHHDAAHVEGVDPDAAAKAAAALGTPAGATRGARRWTCTRR